jgi:CheY-like chemotaxis protein
LALLAGRKLLLADDSVTIQKVIELTFADEGVRVIAFGNGDEALEHLDEVAPDIVLADIFMPGKSGYEVCEHIKNSEKLKHIPVMLLVGSFEPFDEAEARRVGANDILTKPFQSIRRLIDRVGSLVGGRPVEEEEVPTAELPHSDQSDESVATEQHLDTDELALTTADTQPLPPELKAELEKGKEPAFAAASTGEHKMETAIPETRTDNVEADSLLDLGDFEPLNASAADDFVLDLDTEDDGPNGSESFTKLYDAPPPPQRAFVEPAIMQTSAPQPASAYEYQPEVRVEDSYEAPQSYDAVETYQQHEPVPYEDQVHEISAEPIYAEAEEMVPVAVAPEPVAPGSATSGSPVTADSLSPEMIDAIARRAVEMLSDKVVREIAWDVVPELAELLIKQRLEEKESQAK